MPTSRAAFMTFFTAVRADRKSRGTADARRTAGIATKGRMKFGNMLYVSCCHNSEKRTHKGKLAGRADAEHAPASCRPRNQSGSAGARMRDQSDLISVRSSGGNATCRLTTLRASQTAAKSTCGGFCWTMSFEKESVQMTVISDEGSIPCGTHDRFLWMTGIRGLTNPYPVS